MVHCMLLGIRIFCKMNTKVKPDKIWKKFIISLLTLEINHIKVNGEFLNF